MDLTSSLLRVGARRPHVLLVPALGGTAARLAVERTLARREWPSATGPADADLLVVAGSPGPTLGAVIDRTWTLIPAPRARIEVTEAEGVTMALDAGVAQLADREHQRAPERTHPSGHHSAADESHHDDQHPDADPRDGHHDTTTGEHDEGHGGAPGHSGHHGQDAHGGGGMGAMEMPGGLPMADLGEDRDGLTLDRLHVPLGPVLPDWPVGLVLRAVLQGDVIQEAEADVLDRAVTAAADAFWDSTDRAAARELDALARLLSVAGWVDAASRSRRLRDDLLAGHPPERVTGPAADLVGRIRRSRTLRWLVRGIPSGTTDLTTLVEGRLDAVGAAFRPGGGAPVPFRGRVADLPGMLVGAELAAARLIVAAVDPDTEAAPVHGQAQHG
jgi:hypothetical protein